MDKVQFQLGDLHKETDLVQTVQDPINTGALFKNKNVKNTEHHTYVDDNHMAAALPMIRQAIAASIEACYIIFGEPPKRPTRKALTKL